MAVKNAKEAVIEALKRNPQGLRNRSTWRNRDEGSLLTEASKVRWPNTKSPRLYRDVSLALKQLILEGQIYVKLKGWDSKYFYNPKKGSEQFGEFLEMEQRIKRCSEKLEGHGFSGLKIRKKDPVVWLRSTPAEKEGDEFVQIHIKDLEEFIQEFRSRERRH